MLRLTPVLHSSQQESLRMSAILCVDDSCAGLAVRKRLLKYMGHSVLTAEDAATTL